jgi:hypothetical protein
LKGRRIEEVTLISKQGKYPDNSSISFITAYGNIERAATSGDERDGRIVWVDSFT